MKMREFHIVLLVFFFVTFKIQADEMRVYTDTLSAGWHYMDSCVTFEIQIDSICKVAWTVTKMKKEYDNDAEKLDLTSHPYDYRSHSQCLLSFNSVVSYHQHILDSIFSRWSPKRFKSLSYSSFRHGDDYSWNLPIAILSAASPKYQDYRNNYPKTNININALFVELANESNAYKELADLMADYGLKLSLTSVEKVFSSKVKELPFQNELLRKKMGKEERVLWDVGMSYFSLSPIK